MNNESDSLGINILRNKYVSFLPMFVKENVLTGILSKYFSLATQQDITLSWLLHRTCVHPMGEQNIDGEGELVKVHVFANSVT